MAKRGRKKGESPKRLPSFDAEWRSIYQEVWDLNVVGGVKLTEACNEVGARHGMKGPRVRKLVKKVEEHHESMRRMIERGTRGLALKKR